MSIAGILGSWELLVTLGGIALIAVPVLMRKMRGTQDYTERLDQLERLERLYRDGSLSEREFKRQKRKIMKKK
jgi:uncharacterized membrane protein